MKIALAQLGRIGDMILLTAGLPAIKRLRPEPGIHIVASRHNAAALKGNPNVDRVIVYDKSPTGFVSFVRKLRRERYDFWIDPKDHFSRESNLLARLARANYKIGRDGRPKSEWGRASRGLRNPFDYVVPSDVANRELHYVERLSNALAPLGIDLKPERDRPRLYPSQDSLLFAENFLSGRGGKAVYVNISASSASRMLPGRTWIEALGSAKGDCFYAIGAMPRDAAVALEIASALGAGRAAVYPARGLEDVIAIVSRCAAIVTPDTAPVHIASAFDVPTLAVFFAHAANLSKFRPLAPGSRVIIDENATNTGLALPPDKLALEINQLKLKVTR